MFFALAIVLFVVWLGLNIASFTLDGLAHLLLLFAVVAVIFQVVRGKKPIS